MLPVFQIHLFDIAVISVPAYGLFAILGAFFAMILSYFRVQRLDFSFKRFLLMVGIIVLGCVLGSKALFILTELPKIIEGFTVQKTLQIIWTSGFVFYGGLLGAIGALRVFARMTHIPFHELSCIVTPAFPLFHAIGRIGCFFAGCCYGIQNSWGVAMANDPDIVRIPVQLFESLTEFTIFLTLLLIEKRSQKGSPNLLCAYLVMYSLCRFFLEFLRGDLIRGIWILGLSTSQIISILIFAIICVYIFRNRFSSSLESTV